MRISIIAILVSISAMCFGQWIEVNHPEDDGITLSDSDFYWLPVPPTNHTDIKEGETITIVSSSSLKYEIIRLYDEYAAQLPTNKRHIDPLPSWGESLADCDLKETEKSRGFESWIEIICRNEDHFVDVPIKSSFEGFIKWLRTK